MTDPLEPNDLSHLSDEEFMALCPQGFHGTGDFEPLADEAILALAEEYGVGYVCPDGCVIYPFQDGTNMRDSLLSFARAALERWGDAYPTR